MSQSSRAYHLAQEQREIEQLRAERASPYTYEDPRGRPWQRERIAESLEIRTQHRDGEKP